MVIRIGQKETLTSYLEKTNRLRICTNALFSGMTLLSVNGISRQERGEYVVKNISFTQQSSQKVAVAGETGSGKTTLLKLVAGLVQPDSGEILFNGKRVLGPFEKLLPGHPKIGFLSQHFELRNNYRVEEELEAKNLLTDGEASRIYAICRIDHLLKRKTDQLSGGERQRIVLARLLTTSPELLLLDEPFSNLDAIHKSIIKSVITDIGKHLGVTCLLVSHEAADTLSWADLILVMQDGQVVQAGSPEEIYRLPVNEYCAGLFGDYNLLDAETYFSLTGNLANPAPAIVRPENLKIDHVNHIGIPAIVEHILFYGDRYIAEVSVNNKRLKVKLNQNDLVPGDKVKLNLAFT
jgi:ABC-type sugar transport system ATPase subunit